MFSYLAFDISYFHCLVLFLYFVRGYITCLEHRKYPCNFQRNRSVCGNTRLRILQRAGKVEKVKASPDFLLVDSHEFTIQTLATLYITLSRRLILSLYRNLYVQRRFSRGGSAVLSDERGKVWLALELDNLLSFRSRRPKAWQFGL